ncbi:MAG: DUF308 domain-containing protein [Coriobacteriia bacterium]|nr:DUF308 domain-containing protein [Coriobacteriia bacterium]
MTTTEAYIIEPERKSKHYKWWFVALGAVITLLGVACLIWPAPALMAVAITAGIGFLAAGVSAIAAFFDMGGFAPLSGWSLLNGIIDVLLGVMFLVEPMVGGITVAWMVGIFVVVAGVMDGVASWRMRGITGNGMCALGIVGAVLTVIFGILMMAMPALFIIYLGCMLVMRGIIIVVAAFQISAFVKRLKS